MMILFYHKKNLGMIIHSVGQSTKGSFTNYIDTYVWGKGGYRQMSTLLYNPYRVKWSMKEGGVEKVPKTVYVVCE